MAHDTRPRCQTIDGCPVKAYANDRTLQRSVDTYLEARYLMEFPHLHIYGQKLLASKGLDDPYLLATLEEKFQKYKEYKYEQKRQKEKMNHVKGYIGIGEGY
jgi:hypothetical protein